MTHFPTSEDLRSFRKHIEAASRIAITTHARPDGDALGSTTALLSYLKDVCGIRDVKIILNDPVADSLRFAVSGFGDDIFEGRDSDGWEDWVRESDLIFCLDCSGLSRTEGLEKTFRESPAPKILIDHHVGPERAPFELVFSDTEVSSACEILYRILSGLGTPLPLKTATALMTGMLTDTNNFANSVFPGTLEMASALQEVGVDRDRLVNEAFNSFRTERLTLLGHLLDHKLEILPCGGAFMILTLEEQKRFGVEEGDTEGFVNIPLTAAKIRLSVFLRETSEGHLRVSVRSKKGTSARILAETCFHGGGHENAAGGKLRFPSDIPSPEDAAEYVREAIAKHLAQ